MPIEGQVALTLRTLAGLTTAEIARAFLVPYEIPYRDLEGEARMTVFAAAGAARTFDFQAGDVGHVPFAMGHYVENRGDGPLRFLEMFRSDHFAEVSLHQWLAPTPPELARAHLHPGDEAMAALQKEKPIIVKLVDRPEAGAGPRIARRSLV